MRKTALTAVLGAALVALPATAVANHGGSHKQGPKNPQAQGPKDQAKRCGVVRRGFVLSGSGATFTPTGLTANPDGTYDGSVRLVATHGNRHARRAINTTDTNAETFQLDNVRVTLEGVTDRTDDADTVVNLNDVLATDRVKLIGKIPYAKRGSRKNPCANQQGFGADRYGDPVIRKIVVSRPAA